MKITHLPAEPDPEAAHAAVMAQVLALGERSFPLPEDVGTDPVLSHSGGCAGTWVTADGASLDEGVVLYVHGGGFHHRMPDLISLFAAHVSRSTLRPVFVAHYGLAPEHTYPEPLDDVLAAYRALLDQEVPAERITVLSESSGGTLALSALLALKAAGTPLPASVIAFAAVTDLTLAGPSLEAESSKDPGVNRALLSQLVSGYLGGAAPDHAPQSPLHGDLTGLPPLLLAVGSAEALRDDTLRFAQAASDAGTEVSVDVYEAMPHAFQVSVIDENDPTGRTVLERVTHWITKGPRR